MSVKGSTKKTKNLIFSKIFKVVNNPKFAFIMIWLFFITFFLSQGLTSGFDKNFLKFGPTEDDEGNPTTFLGIKLKNWHNVIIAYIVIFFTSVLSSYYKNVIGDNLHAYIWNPAVKEVKYSKFWTYLVLLIDPIVNIIIYVIKFFATATFQVQYILPQFLASYFISLPFTLKLLNSKTFI